MLYTSSEMSLQQCVEQPLYTQKQLQSIHLSLSYLINGTGTAAAAAAAAATTTTNTRIHIYSIYRQ